MTCKHPITRRMTSYVTHADGWQSLTGSHICIGCREWLSLGPANVDAGIEIEIRAAEIASQWDPMDRTVYGERDGWAWHKDGYMPDMSCPDVGTYDERLAGYLARCIVEHKEGL